MSEKINVVGIVGSLRKDSVNRKLLNVAKTFLDDSVTYSEMDISDVPLFNQDLEHETPKSIQRIREQALKADAFIFVTPEYNSGVPGVLKNVVDWLSRPLDKHGNKPLVNKTAYVMGATTGISGTITPQEHLRSILAYMGVFVLPSTRTTVPLVANHIDDEGNLELSDMTLGFLKDGIENFVKYSKKLID